MNTHRSRITAVMTLLLSILALYAATASILNENIYQAAMATGVYSAKLLPGSLSQDIISIPCALGLLILSVLFLKNPGQRTFIAILGLAGFFLYGYGLFVISGLYTSLYLIYMLIFMLSLYSLIYGLLSFRPETVERFQLSVRLRKGISAFLLLIVVIFVPTWLIALYPETIAHTRPPAYAVYVFDLILVMPVLTIISYQLIRNKPFGNILAGLALIKAFTLILSVVIGEAIAPLYGTPANLGMIAIYSGVVVISLWLGILYTKSMPH